MSHGQSGFLACSRILAVASILGASGIGAFYTTNAHAAAGLCTTLNGMSQPRTIDETRSSTKGDKYSITAKNNDAFVATAGISYTDDSGTTYLTATGGSNTRTIPSGASEVFTFTVPADDNSARFNMGSASNILFSVTCTPASQSDNASSETTTSQVVSSVSRSQTTVIQQNIGARVSAITGSIGDSVGGTAGGIGGGIGGSGGSTTGTTGGGTTGTGTEATTGSSTDATNFAGDSRDTDPKQSLRRLAMIGDFDSSRGSLQLLGLGPTDKGEIGGAGGIDGRTALSSPSPFTLWGHGSFTSVDNDFVSGAADNRYDGDVWGYNIGLDYSISPILTAGMSVGYNSTDLTTSFNSGTYEEDGWVLSPYAIYRPIAGLNLVAEAGFGMGEIDVTRNNGSVRGDTDSDLWYAALRGSYRTTPIPAAPSLAITPSLGVIAARKTVESYRESDGTAVASTRSNTRQITPSIEASYDIHPTNSLTLTPFSEAGLVYDFTDEINDDATAFNIGGGLRLSDRATGLNAALEGNYLAGRRDYNEYTLAGTVTYGFSLYDGDGRNLGLVKPFLSSNLNEYGNQRLRTGLGFDSGPLTSELAFTHMLSLANDTDEADASSLELRVSMPF